jgi:3-hydroxyacyl-CoA dehydrogenase/enoyl-CoA hydratase/3-hydroxybutyryl-CoA epimerase
MGERVKPGFLLATLFKDGYYGKKNGKGFYIYNGRKRGGPDPAIYGKMTTCGKDRIDPGEVVDRAVFLMVREAALCLEENIIDRPDLLDASLIFGIGFPPFRGGLLRYADKVGAKTVVEKLEGFAKKYGDRFAPPASLAEMAKTGKGFYS